MKKMFWISAFLLFGIVSGQAQDKYGHLNFGNLIAQMPQTKTADEKLKVFGDSLVTDGEQKAAAFGQRAQAFVEKVQKGELPPVEQQKQQQALEQEQAALQQLDLIIQQQVAAKREELLKPIVDQVESARSSATHRPCFWQTLRILQIQFRVCFLKKFNICRKRHFS